MYVGNDEVDRCTKKVNSDIKYYIKYAMLKSIHLLLGFELLAKYILKAVTKF